MLDSQRLLCILCANDRTEIVIKLLHFATAKCQAYYNEQCKCKDMVHVLRNILPGLEANE